jgi:hypothetical protein
VGQLGESGEYWMGRSESGPHDIRSSKGGSPVCVDEGPRWLCPLQQALSCVLMHMGTNSLKNLVARWSPSWTIPYFASRMIEGILFGPPTDYPMRFLHGRWH